MHPVRRQRLLIVLFIVIASSIAIGLMLFAFREGANLFYPPAEVAAGKAPVDKRIRVGGMVKEGSIQKAKDSLQIRFLVTDYAHDVPVVYEGILPDLFDEGEGAVATGKFKADGVFYAEEILAKHDENYMPPEVADALNNQKQNKNQDKASNTTSQDGANSNYAPQDNP